jgi:hypothetical protein
LETFQNFEGQNSHHASQSDKDTFFVTMSFCHHVNIREYTYYKPKGMDQSLDVASLYKQEIQKADI